MANEVYPKWKEAVQQHAPNSSLAGTGATGVYAVLVDTNAYTYSAAHEFYSSLAGIASTTEQEIANKTFSAGVFDGDDISFPSVALGNPCEAIVLFIKNAGASTTWRLYAYIDTGVTGLPVTPNGGDLDVTWNPSGIVAL